MAIKEAVGKELDRLEREGILKKVTYSEWAVLVVGNQMVPYDCVEITRPQSIQF